MYKKYKCDILEISGIFVGALLQELVVSATQVMQEESCYCYYFLSPLFAILLS